MIRRETGGRVSSSPAPRGAESALPLVEERIRRISTEERTAVLPPSAERIPAKPRDGIVAALPAVRLERGVRSFRGRRRSLRFQDGESRATLRARVRPVPSRGGHRHLERASEAGDRTRPVACADPRGATIHLLVDLAGAEIVAGSGPDPVGAVAETLFGRPLRALLRGSRGAPRLGPDLERSVAAFLGLRHDGAREVARREAATLRHMVRQGGVLPPPLQLRLALAEGSAEEKGPENVPEAARREVARLEKLVADRAAAFLRFGDGAIHGFVGPRPLGEDWLGPATFELRLGDAIPGLRIRNPADRSAPPLDPCLGAGFRILPRLGMSGDVYGLVDGVINFLETNDVGRATYSEWPEFHPFFPF